MGWRKTLKNNAVTIDDIREYVNLSEKEEKELEEIIKIHPMSITKYYLSLIDKNDPDDPVRQIAIPSLDELDLSGVYDTSGESENTKLKGLQHKYENTALVLSTNRCAVYCRHCFRKRLIGLDNDEILARFSQAVKYVKEHREINNVLISGGDPLVLPTKVVEKFITQLFEIDHIDFIRFGSRIPVVLPERIYNDKNLLEVFHRYSSPEKRIYVTTHFNHANEITSESIKAVNSLINSNIIVNNQTVLLKGVNNKPEVLTNLMTTLVRVGVIPYYIFQCRPVKRVKHHFQISFKEGYNVIENAKKKLSGYGKRFKYVFSHKTGKIEVMGIKDDEIYFKYHEAKNPDDIGKFFSRKLVPGAAWLDDFDI